MVKGKPRQVQIPAQGASGRGAACGRDGNRRRDEPAPPAPSRTRKRTRIQEENEEKILDAALEVFSTWGYRGATVDQIAALAGMTKPNLLYYFRRKEDIYLAVLNRTHEMWLEPLEHLDAAGDPATEIAAYIDRKLEMSRDNPKASRLFAMEIIQGAPILGSTLRGRLKTLVDDKAAVIRRMDRGGPPRAGRPAPPHLHDLGDHPALRRLRHPDPRRPRRQGHPPRSLRRGKRDAGAGVSHRSHWQTRSSVG